MAAGELSSLPEKFAWFEKKLRAALSDSSVTASELAKLLTETDNAVAAAAQEAIAVRERGLDFVASPDAKLAREAMEDAQFFVGRLQTQRPQLEALLNARLIQEQTQAYVAKRDTLRVERDMLERELTEVYSRAAGEIVALFQRVNQFKQRAHRELGYPPPSVDPLPELAVQPLLDKTQLFQLDGRTQLWPPPSTFAADFVQSMGVPQHPGAVWSDPEFRARRAAERAAENERLARIAEERAAAQLERENRELREQWDSRQQNGGHETR